LYMTDYIYGHLALNLVFLFYLYSNSKWPG
jgi:hypothetical protein